VAAFRYSSSLFSHPAGRKERFFLTPGHTVVVMRICEWYVAKIMERTIKTFMEPQQQENGNGQEKGQKR
jgi:hypothetical protein